MITAVDLTSTMWYINGIEIEMEMNMLLPNGAMIKQDVIESFNRAIENPENINQDGSINWDFIDADINLDCGYYSSSYLAECFDVLADQYLGM